SAPVPGERLLLPSVPVSLPAASKLRRRGKAFAIVACLGLLVVAGGLLWHFLYPSAEFDETERFLPDKVQIVLSARVEQILSSGAYKEWHRASGGKPQARIQALCTEQWGLPPERIARLTIGIGTR